MYKTKKYIGIITIRFSDHLKFESEIEVDLERVLVPFMLIQPLVENSIKHGYSIDHIELKVILKIYKENIFI